MTEPIMESCGLCQSPVQRGPHRWEGNVLKRWHNALVCDACYGSNEDGWSPHHEEMLIAYLDRKGLPRPDDSERNEKGWLPRG